MMDGAIWGAVGLLLGMHMNRLQHNVLAKPTKAQELAQILRAISDRWLEAGSIVGAWRGDDVEVAISEAEGRALDDAAVFCARFGHLQEPVE